MIRTRTKFDSAAIFACHVLLACSGNISEDEPNGGSSAANTIGGAAGSGGSGASEAGSAGEGGDDGEGGGGAEGGAAGSDAPAGAGGMLAAGAGGSGGEQVSPDPNRVYCDAVTEVFQVSCGNGSCHSNPRVTIGDFAVGPEEAAAFVDKPSVRNPACGFIIDSEVPGRSLILTKVTGGYPQNLNCGAQMPVGSFGEVTGEQVLCIADWVQQFQR